MIFVLVLITTIVIVSNCPPTVNDRKLACEQICLSAHARESGRFFKGQHVDIQRVELLLLALRLAKNLKVQLCGSTKPIPETRCSTTNEHVFSLNNLFSSYFNFHGKFHNKLSSLKISKNIVKSVSFSSTSTARLTAVKTREKGSYL